MLHFLLFIVFVPGLLSVSDRRCGSDPTNMWLDVVFVIDNSKGMNMYRVFDTISALFDPTLQIGTGYVDPRSTRVGFVTYNYNATDVADFYKLQSWTDLNSQIQRLKVEALSLSASSYLDTGLVAAQNMITAEAGFRDNYKKIVVVFTSNYGYRRTSPKTVAGSLQNQGVSIVTINTGSDRNVASSLLSVASDRMAFSMSDGNTTQEVLKTMLDVNCFCRNNWIQYQYPVGNVQNRYGSCVFASESTMNRLAAQDLCHRNNGFLVNELDQQKRSFNFEILNFNPSRPVNAFYNGLTFVNSTWFWDQPTGKPLLKLDPNSGSVPSRSACVADMKYSDGTTAWTPVSCSNQFYFLCETPTCDSDNYCE